MSDKLARLDGLLSINESARYLGITRSQLVGWARRGKIETANPKGKKMRFDPSYLAGLKRLLEAEPEELSAEKKG